jgi:hypothetical protein
MAETGHLLQEGFADVPVMPSLAGALLLSLLLDGNEG